MDNLTLVDSILLGDNVIDGFYNEYTNNDELRSWLGEVLPELNDCFGFEQNNPWHIYDVLTHILHTIDEINKMDADLPYKDRRMLAYVMLFHDIGKPASYFLSNKNGKRVGRFFGHNVKSKDIAEKRLSNFGFNDSEIKMMSLLILKHDIFMWLSIDTPDANHTQVKKLAKQIVQSEINELNSVGDGVKLAKFLVMIGRSDSLSQNPEMTQNAFFIIDRFEDLILECNNE